jgi:osmotically-inducible protein OsmY
MVGQLLRAILLIIVLVAVGAFLLGWWGGGRARSSDAPRETVGTTGASAERAREVGAEIGERTGAAADQARRALNAGSITAKIKAKLALDDSVKALDVNIDTAGSTVTVRGTVDTAAQKERVLQLAKETDGVTKVVDRMAVRK